MAAPAFIARYEVKQCLGRGGMGAIYLARDPLIDRLVAVKLLHADFASDEFRARFAQEAHASGGLSHPHIVTIHDYGEADDAPFIVMEYVSGETLASLIRRAAPIPVIQKLLWTEQICSALGYAHSEGIIHRDIKPSNLMLDQHGTIRVVDFGIARLVGGVSTKMSSVIGTPGYMSPEQIQGGTIDARSDIFALGTVLYELLSYHEAFAGETPHAVMHRVIAGQPTPLAELVQGRDLSIVPVVETAMRRDPARRYQKMAEFEAAVRDARTALERTGHDLTVHAPRQVERARARRRTDPADLARRRAEQIQQHIDRARQAKEAGDSDAAIAACEDALLMDPGFADALDLLEAIRGEAPSISAPPPWATRPVPTVSPPLGVSPPSLVPARVKVPPRTAVVEAVQTKPWKTGNQAASVPVDLTDVGEQPLRPWETTAWNTASALASAPPPGSRLPARRGRIGAFAGGAAIVTFIAGLVWAASAARIALGPEGAVGTAPPSGPGPAAAAASTSPAPAALARAPTASPLPVSAPPIEPAAAERQASAPPPAVGKATVPDSSLNGGRSDDRARTAAPKAVDAAAVSRMLQRAESVRSSGDLAQALTLYREVLRLEPGNLVAGQAVVRIRVEYLLRRARSLVDAEDYDAALRDLDAVAADDPNSRDADALRKEIAAAKSRAPRKPKG